MSRHVVWVREWSCEGEDVLGAFDDVRSAKRAAGDHCAGGAASESLREYDGVRVVACWRRRGKGPWMRETRRG